MGENIERVAMFKKALGNYPTGISVVTAIDENNEPIGLTVNSFASVSIDPLLVLWSIDQSVTTYDTFRKIDKFAINILAANQRELAVLFSTKEEERFDNCEWTLSESGLPLLTDAMATLECDTFKTVEVGDHTTLFGHVKQVDATEKAPLLYHRRHIGPFPEEFYNK